MSIGNELSESLASFENGQILRPPQVEDGAKIHQLVKSCKPLDLNSVYCYLLMCQHFAETCVVADEDGKIVAFLSGYIPPSKKNVFFVWQVAVDGKARKRGCGKRLLREVLQRPRCRDCHFLETTITPSNHASQNLFRSFAEDLDAPCEVDICFSDGDFGQELQEAECHEAEHLFRIGPFDTNQVK